MWKWLPSCTLLPKQNRRNKTESQCPATKLQLELRGQYLSLITILNVAIDKIKIDTRCIDQHKANKYKVIEKQEGILLKRRKHTWRVKNWSGTYSIFNSWSLWSCTLWQTNGKAPALSARPDDIARAENNFCNRHITGDIGHGLRNILISVNEARTWTLYKVAIVCKPKRKK